MNNATNTKDYEILGYKVTLKNTDTPSLVGPDEIVELVREKSQEILKMAPHLEKGQVAVLAALSIAEEKLKMDQDFQTDIKDLHFKANNALKALERISASTIQ